MKQVVVQIILCGLVGLGLATASGATDQVAPGPEARERLLDLVVDNAGLDGDITVRLRAQGHLVDAAAVEPEAVVGQVLERLNGFEARDPANAQPRIALIELLRDIGPDASAALPELTTIANADGEPNEWVRHAASLAIATIGAGGADVSAADDRAFAATGIDIDDELMRARNPNPDIAAAALGNLITAGHYDRAAPALIAFLTTSDRAEDFLMSIGWGTMHGALPETAIDEMVAAIERHIAANADQYTVDQRVRIGTLLGSGRE